MKATGIVRRVDELGRIVIPKEIRKTLRMKEGTPLEIYVSNNAEIMLKKYSPLSELDNFASEAVESIFSVIEHSVLITDKDEVIMMSGKNSNEYIKQQISIDIEKIIANRQVTISNKRENATIYKIIKDDENDYSAQIIAPINAAGDTIGSIIIFSKEPMVSLTNTEVKVASTMANFLAKQME